MTERVFNSSGFRLGASLLASCAVLAFAAPSAAQAEVDFTDSVAAALPLEPLEVTGAESAASEISELGSTEITVTAVTPETVQLASAITSAPDAPVLSQADMLAGLFAPVRKGAACKGIQSSE